MAQRLSSATMLLILTLASAAQEQKQKELIPVPEDRATDTYDVYDAAVPSPIWGQGDSGTKYYIIDKAVKPNSGWHPEECIQPPNELRAKVSEMLDDLKMQADSYKLEPRFKLAKPYQLISSDPAQRREGEIPPHSKVIALGIVSFSKDRSLASVVVWSSCGQLCGESKWEVFMRGKNGWEEKPWSRCGAIA
jgi:hypothetical protein